MAKKGKKQEQKPGAHDGAHDVQKKGASTTASTTLESPRPHVTSPDKDKGGEVVINGRDSEGHAPDGHSDHTSPSLSKTASAKRRERVRKGGGGGGHKGSTPRMSRRRQLLTSIIGFALGVLALYFAQRSYPEVFLLHFNALPALPLPPLPPITMPNISLLTDVLPSGLEIQSAIFSEINRRLLNFTAGEVTSPGMEARAKNYSAKYPVVMIPGFVTTGLEVWEGEKCAQKYFRQRLWGTLTMLQSMIFQSECWAKHMSLDMSTGLDPPGIRLRPAQGFEAADFFLPGLWVWAKLIQDLSLLGYDYKSLSLQSFDWRLNPVDLEKRDRYFTLLKAKIELMKSINGEKVVLIAHSYGTNVMLYFFKWVESDQGGNGGKRWVEDHIETFVNIAGPLLGVIKAMTSYISGEMHDTAELGALENILWGSDSNVFNKKSRVQLFRTWGSLTAMLPKGGRAVWGNETSEHGQAIGFSGGNGGKNWTVEEGLQWLMEDDELLAKRFNEHYDFGLRVQGFEEDDDPRYWANPMAVQLPHAPSMKVVCYYGVGKPTERAYIYKLDQDGKIDGIDKSIKDPALNISDGVVMDEGDGTVTLLSLGYHCADLWHKKTYNPAGLQVTTRELLHTDTGLMSRGPSSGDHVDIMGNAEMAGDLLRLASGNEEGEIHGKDKFYSRIRELASRIELPKAEEGEEGEERKETTASSVIADLLPSRLW